MDLKIYENLINKMECNICNLQSISYRSINMCEKMFYNTLIQQEMYKVNVLKNFIYNMRSMENTMRNCKNMRQQGFTLEQLLKYDGKNDNKAYIAIDGVVYDVTYNAVWAAGTHFGLKAGRDLSKEITTCHNKEQIIKGLDQIGIIISP